MLNLSVLALTTAALSSPYVLLLDDVPIETVILGSDLIVVGEVKPSVPT
jgi:hypothetical protein